MPPTPSPRFEIPGDVSQISRFLKKIFGIFAKTFGFFNISKKVVEIQAEIGIRGWVDLPRPNPSPSQDPSPPPVEKWWRRPWLRLLLNITYWYFQFRILGNFRNWKNNHQLLIQKYSDRIVISMRHVLNFWTKFTIEAGAGGRVVGLWCDAIRSANRAPRPTTTHSNIGTKYLQNKKSVS